MSFVFLEEFPFSNEKIGHATILRIFRHSLKNEVDIHFEVNNQLYPTATISTSWQTVLLNIYSVPVAAIHWNAIYFDSFVFQASHILLHMRMW